MLSGILNQANLVFMRDVNMWASWTEIFSKGAIIDNTPAENGSVQEFSHSSIFLKNPILIIFATLLSWR